MRVLILGNDNFAAPLARRGAEVLRAGTSAEAEVPLTEPDPDWPTLAAALRARGFVPDLVLVTDDVGWRKLPLGLAACPAVTCFYAVDAPLNRFWQQAYAHLCDLALFDQPAEARLAAQSHAGAHWLPVGVATEHYGGKRQAAPAPGVCFVGVVDPRVRPKRSAVLARVARQAPLALRGGRQEQWFSTAEAVALYQSHQVVLNENLFPGVTTRPLEVLAAGGFLLTEAAPGAMDQFFTDGEELVYYTPETLDQRLAAALADPAGCARVAARGREAVLSGHTLDQRAGVILELAAALATLPPDQRPRASQAQARLWEGEALVQAGLRWPAKHGARRLRRGLARLGSLAEAEAPARVWSLAGLARLAGGDPAAATELLARAAARGDPLADLRLVLAAPEGGADEAGRQARRRLAAEDPALARTFGDLEFHLAAARRLAALGEDLTPGFDRRGLPPAWWGAWEHLRHAAGRHPGEPRPWTAAGDLLLNRGAPNEAHLCYTRAQAAGKGPDLAAKLAQAARQGYLA
ncbi:MAG: glycosyltransferase [Deltaproteobacteria bacterium]|nr:glycosyltransferase [Deltaproteobacteria bacterium]